MFSRILLLILAAAVVFSTACGSKKPKAETAGGGKNSGAAKSEGGTEEQEQAKSRIQKWLGDAASARVTASISALAAQIGENAAKNPTVQKALGGLMNNLFGDKEVKKRIDKVADKATEGLGNKLKLLGKALAAGGVNEYKQQVKEKTVKVAEDVLNVHIREEVMKDPRMSKVIQKVLPVLSMQARLSAATLQSNLSPKVSQKIFGISLKLSVPGKSDATSAKVEQWIASCDGHVENELEKLFVAVSKLDSTNKAVANLAVEVIGHPTSRRELAAMMTRILDDKDAYNQAVKVYEQSAFDKGEKQIRDALATLVAMPVVDTELFKTLETLAAAPGAGDIIEKHMNTASEDPEMAALVDSFMINLLVTCGDIPI